MARTGQWPQIRFDLIKPELYTFLCSGMILKHECSKLDIYRELHYHVKRYNFSFSLSFSIFTQCWRARRGGGRNTLIKCYRDRLSTQPENKIDKSKHYVNFIRGSIMILSALRVCTNASVRPLVPLCVYSIIINSSHWGQ